MMILIFFGILSVIPYGINCNKTENELVLSDSQSETGYFANRIILNCPKVVKNVLIEFIIWKYDKLELSVNLSLKTNSSNIESGRIRTLTNGSLLIEKLQYNDTKIYKCEAYTFALNKQYEANITLSVIGPPLDFNTFEIQESKETNVQFAWKINITSLNIVKKFNITLCESPNYQDCQVKSLDDLVNKHIFSNLKPSTRYVASIIAINDAGTNKNLSLNVETKPEIELPQASLAIKHLHNRNVTLSINCTDCLNDLKRKLLKMFVITFENKYYPVTLNVTTNSTTVEKTIHNLFPYTNYTFFVAVSNGVISGKNASIKCRTTEDVPNPSRNFRKMNIGSNDVKVKWDLADDSFGPITGYHLEIYKESEPYKIRSIELDRLTDYYHFRELKPEQMYIIKLASKNSVGRSAFTELRETTERQAPSPRIQQVKHIGNNVQITWTLDFFKNDLSSITYVILHQICWKYAKVSDSGDKCYGDRYEDWKTKYRPESNGIRISIDIPANRFTEINGNVSFWVKVKVLSNICEPECKELKAESDKFVVQDLLRPKSQVTSTVVIISLVSAAIFIAGILFSFCFCGNKNIKEIFSTSRSHNNYSRPSGEYVEIYAREASQPKMIPLEKTPHPAIEVKDLVEHIMRYRCDDGAGFQTEFEAIEMLDQSRWNVTYPNRKENKTKNRYTNIFPYDHSRVTLQCPANGKSDYINASFVDGYNRRNAYIATQGPLVETIGDFWQMVYEQNSEIIVMITNFEERGRRKCEVYWIPNKNVCYGNISVRQIYEKKMAFYTERRFAIRNIRNKKTSVKDRVVYHYQYTDWRDFDVPPSSLPVLVFVRASIKHWSPNSGPIVVHCSAGVGRTGTYICIESQIRQMEHEHKINVRGFLEHIRQQRMKLVQTESQYTFIHDALYEFYLCPEHYIRKEFFSAHIFSLKFGDYIGFSKQFQMCTQFEPTNYEYIECNRGYNLPKNRSNILPIESRRINLSCELGIEGSNYINASAIQGYWEMKEFIITQHPLEETEPDFWKMIWDENCPIIILLSDEEMPKFWPIDEKDFRTYPWSQVNFCSQEENDGVSKCGFLLSSQREDFNLNCVMHRLKQWPNSVAEAGHLLRLLFTVNAERVPTPIVVVDNFGGSRAGIFVALSSLLHQLRNEDVLDVYFIVKMIHMERPHTFSSSEDLVFIHEVLEHVINNQHSYPFFSSPPLSPVSGDSIPNGVCHSVTAKPIGNPCAPFLPTQYATLNTIRSKSSSSSATFRRRASSAESAEPFCPSSPHNRVSWNPGEGGRYSMMDWSLSSMGNGTSSGGGGGAPTVQVFANPISEVDLPVARILVAEESQGDGGAPPQDDLACSDL